MDAIARPPLRPIRPDLGDRIEQGVVQRFGNGAENFVPPSPGERDGFRHLVDHALAQGDAPGVRAEADALGYEVDPLRAGGHAYWMLQEKSVGARGWGTVILNPAARQHPLIVEVPHPGFDLGTPELGWKAFQAFDAEALIIAGAVRGNRRQASPDVPAQHGPVRPGGIDPYHHAAGVPDYSISDPTHARETAFQAAHQALTGPGAVVLQLHGFSAWKHHHADPAFPAGEQAVLTDCADDHYDPPHLVAAQRALHAAGFRSHIVSFQDAASSELGGTPNVQHQDMAERGLVGPGRSAEFIHLELDTSLRTGPRHDQEFDALVKALRPVFGERPHR